MEPHALSGQFVVLHLSSLGAGGPGWSGMCLRSCCWTASRPAASPLRRPCGPTCARGAPATPSTSMTRWSSAASSLLCALYGISSSAHAGSCSTEVHHVTVNAVRIGFAGAAVHAVHTVPAVNGIPLHQLWCMLQPCWPAGVPLQHEDSCAGQGQPGHSHGGCGC